MSAQTTKSTRSMGLALKALLVCLTVAASAAQAAPDAVTAGSWLQTGQGWPLRFEGGTSTLHFSNGFIDPVTRLPGIPEGYVSGLVGALNVGKVNVTAVDDVTIAEDVALIGRYRTEVRSGVRIQAGVNVLNVDDATGQFLGLQAAGASRWTAPFTAGVVWGGEAVVSNVRFDLVGKKVYADVQALAGTAFERTDVGVHLWDFDSYTGPTGLSDEARRGLYLGDTAQLQNDGFTLVSTDAGYVLRAESLLSGLRVTEQGFDVLAYALGFDSVGSTGYTTLKNVNSTPGGWGSLTSTMYFAPVPEPSTYALMGLGLVGVAAAARRRTKAEKVLG